MAVSRETPSLKSMRLFDQIVQNMTQCRQWLVSIQSPAQKHKRDVKAARASLNAAWGHFLQYQDVSAQAQLQGEIKDYIDKLERVERNYELGVADAEAEYKRQVDAIVRACCEKIAE